MGTGNSTPTPVSQRKHANADNSIKYCEGKIVQNFVLVWLDSNINIMQQDCQYTISELYKIYNSFTLFTDLEECRKFIEKPRDEQIFLIVSGKIGENLVPLVHQNARLDSVYVFCGQPDAHKWTQQWKKIKLVVNQIEPICKALVIDAAQCEEDLTPTSILPLNESSSQQLERINASFMYSQLINEILMEMNYHTRAIDVLGDFCRDVYKENEVQLEMIHEFQIDFHKHTPIWWYTRECFAYRMLNRSLRTFDINIIAMMGFFLKDIHNQIKDINSKISKRIGPFVVYRGQGMLNEEFGAMRNNIGGLVAFNSFLSTSENMNVAMKFAEKSVGRDGKTSVLFEIEVDPALTLTPYASLDGVTTCQPKEKEILFSMHTVFRIYEVKENNDQIWKINLKSVSDKDLAIKKLTEQIRSEIGEGNPIDRLGRVMIKLDEFEKAEAFYQILIESTIKDDKKIYAWIRNQFGYIKYKQGRYEEALSLYQEAMQIQEKMNDSRNLDLATTYSNMGLLYTKLNDTSKALSYHQKALSIRERDCDVSLADLGSTYNNIGLVYNQREDFSDALSHYEKALPIYKKCLSASHPWVATLYKNIGLAQVSLGKHIVGLENLYKAREIRKISLPCNHPSIASVCNSIGDAYRGIEDYQNALKFYDEALDVENRAPHINYSNLALTYYRSSKILSNLEQHDKALEYAKLAVKSIGKASTPNGEDVASYKEHLEQLQT
ncbi:unnamed protein product [Rotaria magnacalcarata]|uniref:NAD(P)(+)--arginine ADP-ribosyltransferase n=5 Tax=Rotaria magnacalcarata TaxID=392030 RepID=A0A816QG95_9BILA|nr:unnamed protein product [Rotaria magnacalcarata]CAF2140681.1 unnamed protein product [Rotaria magnacalcarata]CAF4274416.1 unnamed protein product [Rotaria magnacalcarata]